MSITRSGEQRVGCVLVLVGEPQRQPNDCGNLMIVGADGLSETSFFDFHLVGVAFLRMVFISICQTRCKVRLLVCRGILQEFEVPFCRGLCRRRQLSDRSRRCSNFFLLARKKSARFRTDFVFPFFCILVRRGRRACDGVLCKCRTAGCR